MNISLLCKWLWKLDNESGIWQDIVKAKYIKNDLVNNVKHRLDDSPVWRDLLRVRHFYLRGRKIETNNGEITTFWFEEEPLCIKYNSLFELCSEKSIIVKEFYESNGNLTIRRWLPTLLWEQWADLRNRVLNHRHSEGPDEIVWKWTKNGKYSVKSTYDHLTRDDAGEPYNRIWKAKIPYKVKYSFGFWKKAPHSQKIT